MPVPHPACMRENMEEGRTALQTYIVSPSPHDALDPACWTSWVLCSPTNPVSLSSNFLPVHLLLWTEVSIGLWWLQPRTLTDSGRNYKVSESHGQTGRIVSVIDSSAVCASGHVLQQFVVHIITTITKPSHSHTVNWRKMARGRWGQCWIEEQTILSGSSCETCFFTQHLNIW